MPSVTLTRKSAGLVPQVPVNTSSMISSLISGSGQRKTRTRSHLLTIPARRPSRLVTGTRGAGVCRPAAADRTRPGHHPAIAVGADDRRAGPGRRRAGAGDRNRLRVTKRRSPVTGPRDTRRGAPMTRCSFPQRSRRCRRQRSRSGLAARGIQPAGPCGHEQVALFERQTRGPPAAQAPGLGQFRPPARQISASRMPKTDQRTGLQLGEPVLIDTSRLMGGPGVRGPTSTRRGYRRSAVLMISAP